MKICKRGHQREEGNRCPECAKERFKRYEQRNPERWQQYRGRYKEQAHKRYIENKEKFAEQQRKWRRLNPDLKHAQYKRHQKRHPLKGIYLGMISRCHNPNSQNYADYGGRGIRVCERWRSEDGFELFEKDMGVRPSLYHTVERRDNDLGYGPDNCFWATREEQACNTRKSVKVTACGRTMNISSWAREIGISSNAFRTRLKKGLKNEELIRPPVNRRPYLFGSRQDRLEKSLLDLFVVLGDLEYEGKDEALALLQSSRIIRESEALRSEVGIEYQPHILR